MEQQQHTQPIQQSTKRWLIKMIQQYTLHWIGVVRTGGGVRSRGCIGIDRKRYSTQQ